MKVTDKKTRSLIKSIKNNNLVWQYGLNMKSTVQYSFGSKKKLNAVEKNIIDQLCHNGIAVSRIEDILGDNSGFETICQAADSMLAERSEEIAKLKSRINDEEAIGDKTFNLELLGSELNFDANNVFARFALNNTFLNIANSYFQMYAKLRYYNVWKTFASHGKPRESQLWHFDREDRYILKMFLYLNDVDEGAGPFTYAPGTHKKGELKNLEPEYFIEGGVKRTTDEQMDTVFPKEKWVKGIGKKGTIIFADTRGFHKGGEARTSDRLMFTCMFTSPASESKRLIKYSSNLNLETLTEEQLKAINF